MYISINLCFFNCSLFLQMLFFLCTCDEVCSLSTDSLELDSCTVANGVQSGCHNHSRATRSTCSCCIMSNSLRYIRTHIHCIYRMSVDQHSQTASVGLSQAPPPNYLYNSTCTLLCCSTCHCRIFKLRTELTGLVRRTKFVF